MSILRWILNATKVVNSKLGKETKVLSQQAQTSPFHWLHNVGQAITWPTQWGIARLGCRRSRRLRNIVHVLYELLDFTINNFNLTRRVHNWTTSSRTVPETISEVILVENFLIAHRNQRMQITHMFYLRRKGLLSECPSYPNFPDPCEMDSRRTRSTVHLLSVRGGCFPKSLRETWDSDMLSARSPGLVALQLWMSILLKGYAQMEDLEGTSMAR